MPTSPPQTVSAARGRSPAARDLNTLLCADGIRDSLYQAAGRAPADPAADAARVPPPRTAALAGR